jgi:signal transduction histidine kinase
MNRNNKVNLFTKVFTLIFINIVVVFTVFGIYSFLDKKSTLLTMLNVEAMNVAKSIALVCSDALVIEDDTFLFEFNFDYINQNKNLKNIIVSKKNREYLIIEKEKWLFTQKLDHIYLSKEKKMESYEILFSPVLGDEVYHYTYPIYLSGLQWGWIHVSLDIDRYKLDIKELYLEYFLLFIAILLISFFCSYLIATLFSKPILHLNNIAKQISQGDLSKRVAIYRNDEIGELTHTFNTMVENLEKSKVELTTMNTKLELRVMERTKELKNVNITLKELNDSLDLRVKKEINKRKEQEQILIQQSRLAAMGEMISMIAHQWRQPLNALGVIIQNLHFTYNNNLLDDEVMEHSMQRSVVLTQKMSSTIDDFRDFFKPNKIKENFLLDEVVNQTCSLIEDSLRNNDIVINKNEVNNINIYGFKNELSQVVLNILNNAKDALLDNEINNPKISISVKKIENFAQIVISDNAGGISEEYASKVFEPYFSTKEEKNGTGLGLYMSKIIIEQNMKGKLSFKNNSCGVSFYIRIPETI